MNNLLSEQKNPIKKQLYIYIPCIKHLTNRIIANLLSSELFNEMMKHIDYLIDLCPSPKGFNIIRKSCPLIVLTRWFYLIEILTFINDHVI